MELNKWGIDMAMAVSRISCKELAQRMSCSENNLHRILKRGSCQPITAGKIARALGVPVESIVRKEE